MFNHRGINITVTDNGLFAAEFGTAEINAVTLQEAKDQIDKEFSAAAKASAVSLPIVGISLRTGKLDRGTVVGINRTSRRFMFAEGGNDREWECLLAASPANVELLKQYAAARKELKRLDRLTTARAVSCKVYGRIECHEYAAVLEQVSASYAKSLAAE